MGNFSRDTFNRMKHYVGVRLQQGVPLVDADWNEQEDIRKYELQTFLKWFVGDGVPKGNDGFRILPVADGVENDFIIGGGDGTPEGAGRILVEGWDAINEKDIKYTEQPLYDNSELADKWGVARVPPLTTPAKFRPDTVYLDVWEREVDAEEDDYLVNPDIRVETCTRLKREWAVRVAEEADMPSSPPSGHAFYPLALLTRASEKASIDAGEITDIRKTDLNLNAMRSDVASHIQNTNNPHNVTADQIGALAASAYEFNKRATANLGFSQNDANGASRAINTGFVPKFVWAVSSCSATLGNDSFGVSEYGYADLRGTIIQQCTGAGISRYVIAPYWRQQTYSSPNLCYASFSDETTSTKLTGVLYVRITRVSISGLEVGFYRSTPEVRTDTQGNEVVTRPILPSFGTSLRLLLLG